MEENDALDISPFFPISSSQKFALKFDIQKGWRIFFE